jgi:NADPH:quinone reductase-like Zn-dependent oxidoreductase
MFVWEWGMKAICLRARDGPEALAYDEAQQPRPGEGEVLVRVHAAGVIHTELSWLPTWTNRAGEPRPLPVIPGHEFSGEIAALGAGVRDAGVGGSAIQIVRPLESTAETQAKLQPALLRLSAMISQPFTAADSVFLLSTQQ